MAKLPRLDEVFISSPKPINVGSAYSLKKEGGFPNKKNLVSKPYAGVAPGSRGSKMVESLKPELEKIVQKHCKGDPRMADMLRAFAHDMEAGEGEDPKELDQGGPPAGSTGGK